MRKRYISSRSRLTASHLLVEVRTTIAGHVFSLTGAGEFGFHLVRVETASIQESTPVYDPRVYGAVMAIEWIGDTLVLGTAYGYIKVWGQREGALQEWHTIRVAEGTEVTSLATRGQPAQFKLVIATRDRVIALFDITPLAVMEVYAVQMERTVARTVAFSGDQDIFVLGMFDGMMYVQLRVSGIRAFRIEQVHNPQSGGEG